MANAYDVADFFIDLAKYDENETITNMRINKLLYFSQAWHMVRHNTPLFDEDFEAWDYGPVVPCIYQKYKDNGKNNICTISKDYSSDIFTDDEMDTLLDVAKYYKQFSTPNLVEKTHMKGTPWDLAYQKGKNIIIDKMSICLYFKKEIPLDNFAIPKYFYDTAYCGKRNDDGILILPKEFDEDE
ncbi:Panacea domain-containing protein, partial [Lachnospira multipara]|uniref:Panacea domain-containing protein n=1 Tax=Lachnospira multipara TaxID=28051 RepID=UPI00041E0B9A